MALYQSTFRSGGVEAPRLPVNEVGSLFGAFADVSRQQEEKRRFELAEQRQAEQDARARQLHDLNMAEANRAIEQRDLMNTYGKEAINRIPSAVLAQDVGLMQDIRTKIPEAWKLAEQDLATTNKEAADLLAKRQLVAESRAKGDTSVDFSKEESDRLRQLVMQHKPKGSDISTAELVMRPIQSYRPTQEAAYESVRRDLLGKGIDFAQADAMAASASKGYLTRAQLEEQGRAAQEAAVQSEKDYFDRQMKLIEADQKNLAEQGKLSRGLLGFDDDGRPLSRSDYAKAASGKMPMDVEKSIDAFVTAYANEGDSWFSTLPFSTSMKNSETKAMAYSAFADLVGKGEDPKRALARIGYAIETGTDSDWTGVSITKETFKNQLNKSAEDKEFQKKLDTIIPYSASVTPDSVAEQFGASVGDINRRLDALRNRNVNIPLARTADQMVRDPVRGRLEEFLGAYAPKTVTKTAPQQLATNTTRLPYSPPVVASSEVVPSDVWTGPAQMVDDIAPQLDREYLEARANERGVLPEDLSAAATWLGVSVEDIPPQYAKQVISEMRAQEQEAVRSRLQKFYEGIYRAERNRVM